MAALSAWPVAVWLLIPAFAAPVIFALRGTVATRLVAAQLASAVAIVILLAMSFAFDQDSYTMMAVGMAFLNAAGALVVAITIERWL